MILACFKSLFYAKEQKDQMFLSSLLLKEYSRDNTLIVKIVEIILRVYFDGSSDIFQGDGMVIQNRENVDGILSQLVNSISTNMNNENTAKILSDLWQTRLQNNKPIVPLYTYECLHSVLRIVCEMMNYL